MTEKRFVLEEKIRENEPFFYRIMRDILTSKIYDNSLKGMDDIIILCNNLWEQTQRFENHNQELEKENDGLYKEIQRIVGEHQQLQAKFQRLRKENEQLKKQKARYKRLSEIRNEEINNRILTIKEFIDNCSNEEVKKALEDLFYSEVNEYDSSKKYRKLHEENEDLKEDNAILKQALTRLVEAFDDKISDKSPIRDLIK